MLLLLVLLLLLLLLLLFCVVVVVVVVVVVGVGVGVFFVLFLLVGRSTVNRGCSMLRLLALCEGASQACGHPGVLSSGIVMVSGDGSLQ